ncbi:tyrosine-protein phosphatase non-receptor type 2-like [Gigantopelta aegis]|uniref:tyrosine-protein phosphatase non-receptor type 2-like n=1 Tax=Gigantopelta aegis TaxID=1735272 RepID=UPI001B8884B7|nr:tyrosine-protein phosphatase non-receptor type 2-like [Gigantopelta aegis]
MSRMENEFADYDSANIWVEIYQRLKNEASLRTLDQKLTVIEARKPENRSKNRYRDVSPYDHSRIVLGKVNDDYINASLIEVPDAGRKYILTQGPLAHTTSHFWLMVWEQNTKAVIMLNRTVEKGTLKCHQYWPLGSDAGYEDEMYFDDVNLKVTLTSEEDTMHYTLRYLSLENANTNERREILHFQYTTWPDFGVPSSPTAFLTFLSNVRLTGVLDADVGPPVIHCSAGIGRSGTFCLVDSSLVLIEKQRDLDAVDIKMMLMEMRSFRMGLIQTPDQLRFSYLAIIEGGRRVLAATSSNSTLESCLVNGDLPNDQTDSPPTPPIRTTSISPSRPPPPLPPKERTYTPEPFDIDDFDDDFDDLDDFIQDDDGEDEKDDLLPDNNPTVEKEQESAYVLRKRIRDERKQNTQEKIKQMKDRQQKSEVWKKRRTYLKPICIGLSLLVGGLLLYRYYYQ